MDVAVRIKIEIAMEACKDTVGNKSVTADGDEPSCVANQCMDGTISICTL